MNTVKIFLASSVVEFEHVRDKLAARLRGMNNALVKNGIFLELYLCEDWSHAWTPGRKQEEFNELIRECHFFFAIIGEDVGAYTLEEIGVAFRQFRESGELKQPRIIVFFQDLPTEKLSAEVFRLRARVREAGQRNVSFSGVSDIRGEILTELFISDKVLNPEVLETNRKNHLAVLLKIRTNRKKIERLRKLSRTEDTEAELLVLYRENMVLTEAEHVEWGTLYEYAAFLNGRGYHANAVEVGERLDAHYTEDDAEKDRAKLKKLLGDACRAQGEHERAETYYRAALDLYRELAKSGRRKERGGAAETCAKLAEIFMETYRYEAAERFYREALAYCLDDAGKYARIIAQACRALQKMLKPDRSYESSILRRAEQTAVSCAVQGIRRHMDEMEADLCNWLDTYPCPDTAGEWMKQVEAAARERTREKPDDYEQARMKLCMKAAEELYKHNQMEPAEALARAALDSARERNDEGAVSAICNTLAMILADTKRPNEAERYYQEAIELARKLAERDPVWAGNLAIDYMNLANLLNNTKQYESAEHYHNEALKIWRDLARQDPAQFEPYLATSLHNLADLLREVKRYAEAETNIREALEIYRRLAERDLAQYKPYVAQSCLTLANVLCGTGRHEEAEPCYREALELYRNLVEQDPARFEPNLARTCHNYGLFLRDDRHDPAAALGYFDEAVALWEKYPHYENSLNNAKAGRRKCLGYLHGGL